MDARHAHAFNRHTAVRAIELCTGHYWPTNSVRRRPQWHNQTSTRVTDALTVPFPTPVLTRVATH